MHFYHKSELTQWDGRKKGIAKRLSFTNMALGHDLPALLQSSPLRYQKLVDVMLVSCLKKSNCCSFRSSLFFLNDYMDIH